MDGWPFLVARGHGVGFRAVLAPEFLVAQHRQSVLVESTGPSRSAVPQTAVVRDPIAGQVAVAWAVDRLRAADLATPADRPAGDPTDEHGRPLEFVYGIVAREPIGEPGPDDLAGARQAAVAAYRTFLADEEGTATLPSPRVEVRAAEPAGDGGVSRDPPARGGGPAAPLDRAGGPAAPPDRGGGPAAPPDRGDGPAAPPDRGSGPADRPDRDPGPRPVVRTHRTTGSRTTGSRTTRAVVPVAVGVAALLGLGAGWLMWSPGEASPVAVELTTDRSAPCGAGRTVTARITTRSATTLRYAWTVDNDERPGELTVDPAAGPAELRIPVEAGWDGRVVGFVVREPDDAAVRPESVTVRCP